MQLPTTVILVLTIGLANFAASQDGPIPPRLSIPGAIPISSKGGAFKVPQGAIRVRRPLFRPQNGNISPIPLKLTEDEAKPVTEEPEDDGPEPFIPQLLQQQQQQSQQPQSQPLFQEQNSIQQQEPVNDEPSPSQFAIPRFAPQERPIPQRLQDIQNIGGAQRFAVSSGGSGGEQRPKVRVRPVQRESRPQYDQEPIQVRQSAPRQQSVRPAIQPIVNAVHEHEVRVRRPVSQIVRKYQDENEDGSITWGYENDDGSWKEETIGIDCITRGRYGYVDPDGLKREYNYETGILCDPNKRNQSEEEESGFVDYEGNRAVLPNGVEINLASMGKQKSKRPGAILQQPQQFYKN